MTRASALRALLLASSTIAPLSAWAQPAGSPAAQSGTADAIRVLLDQATYWRNQFQPAKGDEALSRVLVLDPNNADALAMQAQLAADQGNRDAANAALAKLRAARPDDPRIGGIERALQTGPVDQTELANARALARSGKSAEAVAAYRRAFRSDVPPAALATEFYQVLADTDGDWNIPRAGLAGVLRANPQNLQAQLAYAELLTYHDETRSEGMDRLSKLALNPAIADRANKDLRQALLWLPAAPSSVQQFDVYLARHPEDAEIARVANVARTNSTETRTNGFEALQDNNVPEADKLFTAAVKIDPKDVDATIGLGLVRLRERRDAEGKQLLRQAIAMDPSKAEQYQPLIDGTGNVAETGFQQARTPGYRGNRGGYRGNGDGGYAGRLAARRIRAQYARVAALTNAGEFDKAEALLRKLAGKRPTLGSLAYLADIQARAGRLAEAEAGYRAVLARNPRNVQALGGLAGVLSREGKSDEAERLYAQASALPGGALVGRSRSNTLRVEAQQMTDPVAQIGLFRSAVAADPENPWIRLELSRALHSQGQDAEARSVMAVAVQSPRAPVANLQAAIYAANDLGDDAQVVALVNRLPPKERTPQFLAIQTNARTADDVREARALGSTGAERDRLLSLAAQPDPTGVRVAAYGKELLRIGDKPGAREAVRVAMATQPATPAQRLVYGGLLLGAGYPADAKTVTRDVTAGPGAPPLQLAQLRDSIAVVSSDTLNGKGNQAAAYDELAPRLQVNPDSPDLNLALSRLYISNQQPAKAYKITQGLLQQDSSNLNVRSAAVGAALAAGEYSQANDLARESTVQFPDEPQAWLDLANVERARGYSGQALQALRTAKALREKQIQSGATQTQAAGTTAPRAAAAEPLRRGYVRYAQYIPANTANDASPEPLPEPVTRRYAQYDPAQNLPPIETPPGSAAVSSSYAPFSLATPPGAATRAPATPVVMAQNAPLSDLHPLTNPFRGTSTGTAPLLNEPNPETGFGTVSSSAAVSADPLTAQIDQSIQQVTQDVAPRLEGSLSLRGRSGTDGLQKLFEVSAPVEASYSPNGYGRLKVTVTPTYLYSGRSSSAVDQAQFGTNPLGALGPASVPIRRQTAYGTGLDVSYAYGLATADIGATPIGFQQQNVVGGIELAPRLTNDITLRLLGERRAVTDSLLSFGGSKDVRTGEKWGGVTRNRGHLQLEGAVGLANYYIGAGGGILVGNQVAQNSEIDAGMGVSYPVWRTPNKEVRLGADLVYFGYDKNLSGFTLGQGGYFSPQQFLALLFPVSFRHQVTPDLTYTVGGSVGYQTFRTQSSPFFPNDSARQAQLVQLATANPGLATAFGGSRGSGVAGGASGEIDYRVYQNLHIGAKAGFDRSGNFTEGTGLVYARYLFTDAL